MTQQQKCKRSELEMPAIDGNPTERFLQEYTHNQNPSCFREVLNVVVNMTDEEGKAVMKGEVNMVSTLEFAAFCTEIVTSVSKYAIDSYLPTITDILGIESHLVGQVKMKKSGNYTLSTRSQVDPSDFLCVIVDKFTSEVKVAMEEAMCRVASDETSSPWGKWKANCSPVLKDMLSILSVKLKYAHPFESILNANRNSVSRETQRTFLHLQSTTPMEHKTITHSLVKPSPQPSKSDELQNASVDMDSCTNKANYSILDLYKNDVQVEKSILPNERLEPSFQSVISIPEIQKTPNSFPIHGVTEINSKSKGFLSDVTRVVSEVIVQRASLKTEMIPSTRPICTASIIPPGDLHCAADNIVGTVVDAFDKFAESGVINSKSSSHIMRGLDAVFTETVISQEGSQTSFSFFKMVRSYLQDLFMDSVQKQTSIRCETQSEEQQAPVRGSPKASQQDSYDTLEDVALDFINFQPEITVEFEDATLSNRALPTLLPPRSFVDIDGCTDEVIGKVWELYKTEVLLPRDHRDNSKIMQSASVPLLKQPVLNMTALKSEGFLSEAVRQVNNILVKKVSTQMSSVECRQTGLGGSNRASLCTSSDLQHAYVNIAVAVDSVDESIETMNSNALFDIKSSSVGLLDEPVKLSSVLLYMLVEELIKQLVLYLLNHIPIGLDTQEKHFQHVFMYITKGLTDLVMESVYSNNEASDKMEDPVTSLAEHQDMNCERVHSRASNSTDESPTLLSRVASDLVRGTLKNLSCSQESLSIYYSPSSLNDSFLDPTPVTTNQRCLGFRFIVGKKKPRASIKLKSNKVCLLDLTSDLQHKSSVRKVKESSCRQSKVSSSTKKHLTRMSSAFSRALPNLCKSMSKHK